MQDLVTDLVQGSPHEAAKGAMQKFSDDADLRSPMAAQFANRIPYHILPLEYLVENEMPFDCVTSVWESLKTDMAHVHSTLLRRTLPRPLASANSKEQTKEKSENFAKLEKTDELAPLVSLKTSEERLFLRLFNFDKHSENSQTAKAIKAMTTRADIKVEGKLEIMQGLSALVDGAPNHKIKNVGDRITLAREILAAMTNPQASSPDNAKSRKQVITQLCQQNPVRAVKELCRELSGKEIK